MHQDKSDILIYRVIHRHVYCAPASRLAIACCWDAVLKWNHAPKSIYPRKHAA